MPRSGACKLGWGPYLRNLVATGNIIRQAPIGCAVSVVDGAGTAVISDNLFQEQQKARSSAFVGTNRLQVT